MGVVKGSVTIRLSSTPDQIMGAWMSKSKMREIGVKPGDFIYVAKGWNGSLSCRALVKGESAGDAGADTLLLSKDRIYEGNFEEGMVAKCWKHTDWW